MFYIYDTEGVLRNTNEGNYLDFYELVGIDLGGYTVGSVRNEDGDEATEAKTATAVRSERDELLRSSDYTQLPDTPRNASLWATYRQELRDITTQEGFPLVTFPTPPET